MQVSYQYQGKWRIKAISEQVVLVGRPNAQAEVDIDLSPDTTVSRVHAKIWLADGVCWVEDQGSRYGTQVNNVQISTRTQLREGDQIRVGETTLRVDAAA